MATFDQLSAEQRAIVELVLKQGNGYGDLAGMLGLDEDRVRNLAREALVTLSPVSAAEVDEDWRGQVADYLLFQQAGPEATATRGHLRRSEPARAWSRSVLDSLDQFYDPANLPEIPAAEPDAPARRERRERVPRERKPRVPRERAELTPAAAAVVKRRRLAGAGVLAAVVLTGLLFWPVGLVTGGDDDSGDGTETSAERTELVGQVVLRPVEGTEGAGIAVIARQADRRQLIVQARLPATKEREAYEVWLYNSDEDARSLGAQVTDQQGTFQGAGPLPGNFERFKFIDVSLEPVDSNRAHSGKSVLRAEIADIAAPPPEGSDTGAQAPAPQGTTTTP